MSGPASPRPAEKNVARRLHKTLTNNDSLAVVLMQALSRVWLKHRCFASLTCRKSVASSAARKSPTLQMVPTLPTPTTMIAMSQK